MKKVDLATRVKWLEQEEQKLRRCKIRVAASAVASVILGTWSASMFGITRTIDLATKEFLAVFLINTITIYGLMAIAQGL